MDLIAGGCCTPLLEAPGRDAAQSVRDRFGALDPYISATEDGHARINLLIEGMTCGACIRTIERSLENSVGVKSARVNFSAARLAIEFDRRTVNAETLIATLDALGYRAVPFDADAMLASRTRHEQWLLRSMAVAGFAAANVMLLSVAIWAGHFQDMGPGTRTLLHWISGMVAVPAVLVAGRPFYDSALAAIRAGRTNMDVPISLAVLLAIGMSVFQTTRGAEHAYFDSAITLLFFLLIGRYLDTRARGKARSAAERLTGLSAIAATVIEPDGTLRACAPAALKPGMTVLVPAGERMPADGTVIHGKTDVDTQIITGESLPVSVGVGDVVHAGSVNLSSPLHVRIEAAGEGTLLAEIARLMESAEQRRARHVGLADAVSRWYAPVVHILAAGAFAGWYFVGGLAWQDSLLIAIAVLIITCPCALGLAVPAVQVIASSQLMQAGILLKSGSALERLAEIDTVVFDKTGTLTEGRPRLIPDAERDPALLAKAASIAAASSHPLSRALCAAVDGPVGAVPGVTEIPGDGLSWCGPDGEYRLGRREFAGLAGDAAMSDERETEICFTGPRGIQAVFRFEDTIRTDAAEVLSQLRAAGLDVHLLSGDRRAVVRDVATRLNIESWQAEVTPDRKLHYVEELRHAGRKPAMVGDGLNDAPSLSAAFVSMSPASATEISRTAADIVFQGAKLGPVFDAYRIARRVRTMVRQNFALAFLYNLLSIPVALAGLATPLIAAIAMSSSSLMVIGNAMRLGWTRAGRSDRVRPTYPRDEPSARANTR